MKCIRKFLCVLMLLVLTFACFACSAEDELPFRIRNGDRNSPKIAITVDDCTYMSNVMRIYELCKEYHIGVTFFPVGNRMKDEDAELWRLLAADPDVVIGSHTQNHANWHVCSKERIQKNILEFEETLDRILGYHYPVHYLRPPYGQCTTTKNGGNESRVHSIVSEVGYEYCILWNVSNTNPKGAYQTTRNGSILLFHANKKDYQCLVQLIPMLLERGFEPVTIDELLHLSND